MDQRPHFIQGLGIITSKSYSEARIFFPNLNLCTMGQWWAVGPLSHFHTRGSLWCEPRGCSQCCRARGPGQVRIRPRLPGEAGAEAPVPATHHGCGLSGHWGKWLSCREISGLPLTLEIVAAKPSWKERAPSVGAPLGLHSSDPPFFTRAYAEISSASLWTSTLLWSRSHRDIGEICFQVAEPIRHVGCKCSPLSPLKHRQDLRFLCMPLQALG